MPGPTAERADARRNRDAILRAAAELYSHQPDPSVSEVARAAGVTRVTFYRHFADRDALLEALVAEHAREILPLLLGALVDVPLAEAMGRLAEGVAAVAEPQRHLLRALGPRLEQVTRLAVPDEPLVDLLRERRESGELTSPLPDEWLARAVRALCLMSVVDDAPPDRTAAHLGHALRQLLA